MCDYVYKSARRVSYCGSQLEGLNSHYSKGGFETDTSLTSDHPFITRGLLWTGGQSTRAPCAMLLSSGGQVGGTGVWAALLEGNYTTSQPVSSRAVLTTVIPAGSPALPTATTADQLRSK